MEQRGQVYFGSEMWQMLQRVLRSGSVIVVGGEAPRVRKSNGSMPLIMETRWSLFGKGSLLIVRLFELGGFCCH